MNDLFTYVGCVAIIFLGGELMEYIAKKLMDKKK